MRLLGVRLLWIGLGLLAVFVLFVEFVADVGGDEAPIPQPTAAPATYELAAPPWESGVTAL